MLAWGLRATNPHRAPISARRPGRFGTCVRLPILILAVIPPAVVTAADVSLHTGGRGGETDEPFPVLALTLDFERAPTRWWTLLWSWQDTEVRTSILEPQQDRFDLDVHYLHFAGVYRPTPERQTQWFVMAGAGLTWVSPAERGFGDEPGLSLMVGGGAIVPLGKKLGLRFDGRGYFTLNEIELSGTCGGLSCAVDFSGAGAFQFEGLVGLTIRFGADSSAVRP